MTIGIGGKLGSNFFLEVARGNINNVTSGVIIGKNPDVGTEFEDVCDSGGIIQLPSAAENLEIVSDSANDTSAGTGMRTVLVRTLDTDFNQEEQVVTMNGTTPVTLTGTHIRTRIILGITAGSNGTNVGEITLSVTGGGTALEVMLPGNGVSNSSHFTVPADHTLFALSFNFSCPKNQDALIRLVLRSGIPDAATLTIGELDLYQSLEDLPVFAPLPIAEKTDIKLQAKSNNESASVTMIEEFLLVKD